MVVRDTEIPSTQGFFDFIVMKQAGWWREQADRKLGTMLGYPYPYTTNKTIASHHILNCFRELDADTMYLKDHIAVIQENMTDQQKSEEILYASVTFRLIDRRQTFQKYGSFPLSMNSDTWCHFLSSEWSKGNRVFTGSHQTNGIKRYYECQEALRNNLSGYTKMVQECGHLRDVFFTLRTELPGVSGFFAWQCSADLIEAKVIPFDENTWVFLGPGPMRSLEMIHCRSVSQTEGLRYLKEIQQNQNTYIELAEENTGESFDYPPGISELTMKNLEHALCEYSRYIGFQWGSLGT